MTRITRIAADFLTLRLSRSIALLVVATLLPGLTWACEKSLRWDDDAPFSLLQPDGTVVGINIDLNREVLTRLGCQVRLVKLPWARALKELELGRLDILPGAFRKPERERFAYFSGAVLPPSRNILFMHRDALARWPVESLLELENTAFRLGAQTNVSYGPDFHQLMAQEAFAARVALVANRDSLWRMIGKRRIDGVIADEHSGMHEIQALGLGDSITPTRVVVSTEAAELAFSKHSLDSAFVEAYVNVLQSLVNDGTYERIVQRYLKP
ncbi:substrate-binding periplasmic protein [Pseudomonas borbori]